MRTLLVLLALAAAAALVAIVGFSVPAERVVLWVEQAAGGLLSLAFPILCLTAWLAPGALYRMRDGFDEFWERLKGRGDEIEDLTQRINHLGKAHHMAQLGSIFFAQGRVKQAAHWFNEALVKDGELLEARYRLALCRLRERRHTEAAELLEQVFAAKPEYDYGGTYLHLAQASDLAGKPDRAIEIYPVLLKHYPGHPEGCFGYGLLLERLGRLSDARDQMRRVVFSVRNSPSFQRRRNRHLMWKAKWWLWRRRNAADATTSR